MKELIKVSFKVNMLYGNVVPKLGPPNKRVRNYCMKVDESKFAFQTTFIG